MSCCWLCTCSRDHGLRLRQQLGELELLEHVLVVQVDEHLLRDDALDELVLHPVVVLVELPAAIDEVVDVARGEDDASSLSAYLKHGTKEMAWLRKIVATSTEIRLMQIPPPSPISTWSALSAMKMMVPLDRAEDVRDLDVLDHRLDGRGEDLEQVDLGLRGAHVEQRHLAVHDAARTLGEGVLPGHLVARRLAEVLRDMVLAVAADLVVVHLDRLVDLAERDVDLDEQQVLLVDGVRVQLLDELERLRAHREVLVHDELVRRLEDERLDLEARDRVGRVLLVVLRDPVRDLHLQCRLSVSPPSGSAGTAGWRCSPAKVELQREE